MHKRAFAAVSALCLLVPALAAQRLDADINARIRQEANTRSEIMRTLHFLSDVYGPRLTGSPSLKAAGEWAVKTMEGWGLSHGHLEPWEFGRSGWVNERLSAHIVSPVKDQLVGEALAWTPGTTGTISAKAFQLDPPRPATASELTAYFQRVKDQVKGRIVLAGKALLPAVDMSPRTLRCDDAQMRAVYTRDPSETSRDESRGCRGPASTLSPADTDLDRRIDEFLLANGSLVRVNDAGLALGQIVAFHNRSYDPATTVPTVVLRNEDYGRISRILADGTPVELEFHIVNRLYPEGRTAYNAIAEIEGTDRKQEVVILGGHLDSWQAATGATDNAIGCATMMEAARILVALGLRPRRTIRVALWSGEEQGLLGSHAYVQQHFGTFESPKTAYRTLAAYLNLDNGTGRIRGATVFGPAAAVSAVRAALAPFEDLGVVGAIATRSRSSNESDYGSFNGAGLPGISFVQDPIEYETHTHHSNLDTYERVIESDARASAIVIAAVAYELAMRDELLPRFKSDEMPQGSKR